MKWDSKVLLVCVVNLELNETVKPNRNILFIVYESSITPIKSIGSTLTHETMKIQMNDWWYIPATEN